MVKLCDNTAIKRYEYFYFFVIALDMAQVTPETTRMIGGLSSPWIPFLIPIALTVILLLRNPISFNNRYLIKIIGICLIWEIAVTFHKQLFTTSDQSFQFFLFYTIIFAYIHVRVFGKQIVPLYESTIVTLCKISLPLYLMSIALPSVMSSVASSFPQTNLGHNILYLYNYIDFSSEHHLRNSGCSWEPGRFAIMILLGIYCNMLRNGLKFKNNPNILWLIITLATTLSTTGYSIALLMYLIMIYRNSNMSSKIGYTILIIPLIAYLFSLDFMGNKITEQLDIKNAVERRMSNMSYYDSSFEEGEYIGSLGRFEAMYFELENIKHDPILGYGRNPQKSYFSQKISSNFSLTGGILKIIGMHGCILGLFFYILLYKSSKRLNQQFNQNTSNLLLFLVLILSSISYVVFTIPVFMAFWFYGTFDNSQTTENHY